MKRSTALLACVLGLAVLSWSVPSRGEQVRPRDSVVTGVHVRVAPSGDSRSIRRLRPGESLAYDGSVPSWHRIRLDEGGLGFVSKRWTEVVPDPSAGWEGFAVHFIDVGTGDAAIVDMGAREIVIDGGNSIRVLNAYAERTGIIDPPIELVVVTHGDTDHWNGMRRLLGFDGVVDDPPTVLEFWDPGYDRDCNRPSDGNGRKNYLRFVEEVRAIVPREGFLRPLEEHRTPSTISGKLEPFSLDSLPGVEFTLLHSDASPSAGSCSYRINNASVVLMVNVEGVRFLFTGDANGKERKEGAPGTPGHVEEKLLALERSGASVLRADVLKVPHHGSETASTQDFIDAVDPRFAIISASTGHHLPKDSVITRYEDGERITLRTDRQRKNDNDHIVCTRLDGKLTCNFEDVLNE